MMSSPKPLPSSLRSGLVEAVDLSAYNVLRESLAEGGEASARERASRENENAGTRTRERRARARAGGRSFPRERESARASATVLFRERRADGAR